MGAPPPPPPLKNARNPFKEGPIPLFGGPPFTPWDKRGSAFPPPLKKGQKPLKRGTPLIGKERPFIKGEFPQVEKGFKELN